MSKREQQPEQQPQKSTAASSKEDPLFTQCVIAYCNWRKDGGQGSFDLFKRDWYQRLPRT